MATTLDLDRHMALRLQIDSLMADYAHCIDEDRLEEWPEFFTSDGIYRVTFLINPKGKIQKIWPKVKPEEHAAEVLEEVRGG